jgi:hypothetical protein
MSTVDRLLDNLSRIGATIRPAGDRLILRAGATGVPAELVRRIREANSSWPRFRRRATKHATGMSVSRPSLSPGAPGRDWQSARPLAWGDLQNKWHTKHGRRWPSWQCAGCEKPIGSLDSITLPDGNRVHFEPIDCILEFGRRWRGDARRALVALGLEAPDFEEIGAL